eukprot:UN06659
MSIFNTISHQIPKPPQTSIPNTIHTSLTYKLHCTCINLG